VCFLTIKSLFLTREKRAKFRLFQRAAAIFIWPAERKSLNATGGSGIDKQTKSREQTGNGTPVCRVRTNKTIIIF